MKKKWVPALMLLLPLLIVVAIAIGDAKTTSKDFGRITTSRPSPTATPAPFTATGPLPALSLVANGAICASSAPKSDDPVVDRIVLVDVATDGAVDPDAMLGPRLNPETIGDLQFVTVTLRQPAWQLSPGDVVTLIVVPPERPGTPIAGAEQPKRIRVEGVIIITVPWNATSKPGTEGQALVALATGNDDFIDLAAAGHLVVPVGEVTTSPTSESTPAPTIDLCTTPAPHPPSTRSTG